MTIEEYMNDNWIMINIMIILILTIKNPPLSINVYILFNLRF